MMSKKSEAWKGEFLKKLDRLTVWDALEHLRIHGVTMSISSVAPFDPKVKYCEPFNHDEKYQAQVWDEEDQMYQEAFYGKTPEEAFRKAVRVALEE
jgi:hypothetical protein